MLVIWIPNKEEAWIWLTLFWSKIYNSAKQVPLEILTKYSFPLFSPSLIVAIKISDSYFFFPSFPACWSGSME